MYSNNSDECIVYVPMNFLNYKVKYNNINYQEDRLEKKSLSYLIIQPKANTLKKINFKISVPSGKKKTLYLSFSQHILFENENMYAILFNKDIPSVINEPPIPLKLKNVFLWKLKNEE